MALELVLLMRKKADPMTTFRKTFIITITMGMLLVAVIAVVRLATGEGKFFYQARFSQFFVCRGPDPVTGLPQEPESRFPPTVETINACGYLEADGSVPVHFLLFFEGNPTEWFAPTESYQTGYVFREVPPFWWSKPGNYRVEAWLNRHKLASSEFTIVPSLEDQ